MLLNYVRIKQKTIYSNRKLDSIIQQQKLMQIQYLFKKHIPSSAKPVCGCYVKHCEAFEILPKYAMVPLKNINYDIEITNSLVSLTLIQTYYNSTSKNLQVEYSFPLDPNSCIYKFIAQFGNKKIEGVVKQKEQAKKQYQQAIQSGKNAVYGEIDQKSADIMNMQIGNISPNTEVTITICILQELSIARNSFYKLLIPSTISPRYMNENSQYIDFKGNPAQISAKANFTWNFKITLKTHHKVIFFNSPSHKLELLSKNQTGTQTLLIMSQQCIPNKDFQFLYATTDFHLPSYVFGKTDQSSSVMLSFIPKFCTMQLDDAYKAQIANNPFETDMDSAKGQYIFLLDRSGSMGGSRINKAKQALILFLKSLPHDCYFNVISFGNSFQSLFRNSQKYQDKSLKTSIKKISAMSADMGGTNIEKPLNYIFQNKIKQGYPRQIFLLTDGAVSNTQKIISLISNHIKYSRVHTIGIGSGASMALIKGCAEKGKGKAIFISDEDDPSEQIIGMLAQTMSPVINKVNLECNQQLIQSIVPNPKSIPYILKNDVVNFYVTFKGQIQKQVPFIFSYQDSFNKKPFRSQILVKPDSMNQPIVDKMSHFKVIKKLEKLSKDGSKIQQEMFYVKITDNKSNAIKQSIKNQILSQFTAFICVGKQLVDGEYQQFLTKKSQTIKISQPNIQNMQINKTKPKKMEVKLSSPIMKCLKRSAADQPALLSKKKQSIPNMRMQALSSLKSCNQEQDLSANMMQEQQNDDLQQQKQQYEKQMIRISRQQCLRNQTIMPQKQMRQQRLKQTRMVEKQGKLQKKQKVVQKQSQKNLVMRILDAQRSDGCWCDLNVYKQILSLIPNIEIIEKLIKLFKEQIVITYVIMKWMEKYHPEKQYSLILKKALNWTKKACEAHNVEIEQLKQIDTTI